MISYNTFLFLSKITIIKSRENKPGPDLPPTPGRQELENPGISSSSSIEDASIFQGFS